MVSDELSCDISKYRQQVLSKDRFGVIFAGKEFPGSEPFIDAMGKAYDAGYFGNMELGVIPVDSQECDRLAEVEKVEQLPTVVVYSHGKKIGEVTPTEEDAKVGYRKTIEKLIDLSED